MARGQFYLDKSNSKLAGVCSGLADYTGVDPLWIRVALVLLTLFVSFITIPAYIVTALLADKKPLSRYSDAEEERMLRRMGRQGAKSRIRAELSDIEKRILEMERHYSTSNARLAAEIDSLR